MTNLARWARRILVGALLITGSAAYAADSLDALADDVNRLESLRQVKDLQRAYAHYAQAGRWNEMGALFTRDARFIRGADRIAGGAAISKWLTRQGGGRQGLAPGALHFEFIDEPLANLSVDGRSARVRWMSLTLQGDGKGATHLRGGIYENEYVRDGAGWKISVSHFHPQYSGDYSIGWVNEGNADLPLIPFHFTLDESGRPFPATTGPPPRSTASIDQLEARIAALNDEDEVRNLQHVYGYYVDLKLWNDVVDLFAKDAVVEIAGVGTFKGKDGVRRAMERMGSAGLSHGQLNDHPQFDTIVRVQPGGNEAVSRGLELGMLGEADKGTASWKFSVFRNRFVKEDGVWKLRELRIFPVLTADYAVGWGKGGLNPPANRSVPEFLPVVGRVARAKVVAPPQVSAEARLAEARRRLARSRAWDGTENVSSAYGYYIDDFQWPQMAGVFAEKGNKQSPFAGYYIGRDRILGAVNANYGPPKPTRAGIAFHWRIQPVINVAADGRSANLRTRLFHPDTGKLRADGSSSADIMSGMYPNDQTVLENGIWKLWSLEIDEPYFTMAGWKGGWSGVKPATERPPIPPSRLLSKYPPDILMTDLGRRAEHFRGGTGEVIEWPGILPMWFNYRNPVSDREPPLYWPDCVPCELKPEARMTQHGYLMPPTGPGPLK
jgi:hypothetical protein